MALQARDLDKKLRGAFSVDGSVQKDKEVLNRTIAGLTLLDALKQVSNIAHPISGASDEVLLSHYGMTPSGENLVLLGQELGVEFILNQGSARKFKKARAPFVCILDKKADPEGKGSKTDAGSGIPITQKAFGVLGKNAAGLWICLSAGGRIALTTTELQRYSSDMWICIRREKSKNKQSLSEQKNQGNGSNTQSLLARFATMVFENKGIKLLQLWSAAGLSNFILLTLPLFITIVYDRVIPHGAFETLAALTIGVVLVFGIDIGLRTTRIKLQEAIGVGTSLKLQTLFYRKLLCSPLAQGQKSSSGISALLAEIDHVALAMPALFAGLFADLPFIFLMLGLVMFLSGPVVIVPLIGIFLIFVINMFGSMRARKAAGLAHALRMKLQDETVATSMMLSTIKASCAEQELLHRWEASADETAYQLNRSRQAAAISAQTALVVTQLVVAFTIVVGAFQINAGVMTLGNLAASVLLVGRILAPVSQVVAQVGQLKNMGGALKTYFAVIDEPDERGGDETGNAAVQFMGHMKFKDVSFSYEGAANKCLNGINFEIKPGERVGIIGRNGCGKSTLLKLIPRFFDPTEGFYSLDGNDARQISPRFLRRSIGIMSQDTVLMDDSLRANICLGVAQVSQTALEQAAKTSGVLNMAQVHPEGFNLAVGPRGEALSGGERQQVGLARAILKNPKMLILDEPTSAMDNSTEARLIDALPAFLEGRTLILATHRTQMLALVDRVILMENGKIIADGPKHKVLATLLKAS